MSCDREVATVRTQRGGDSSVGAGRACYSAGSFGLLDHYAGPRGSVCSATVSDECLLNMPITKKRCKPNQC